MERVSTTLEDSKSERLTRLCARADQHLADPPAGPSVAVRCRARTTRHVAPRTSRSAPSRTSTARCCSQLTAGSGPPAGHRHRARLHPDRRRARLVGRRATPSSRWSPTTCRSWSTRSRWRSAQAAHDVHLVIHPQLVVRRDMTGQLQRGARRAAPTSAPHDVARESWMHLEIDRESDRRRARRDRASSCARCSATSARPSRTGSGCTPQVDGDRRRPRGATRRRCRPTRSSRARRCCAWLGDDHFTFLGYREYRLERASTGTTCCAPCPAPASASCAPTRTCRRARQAAAAGRARRRARRHLLVLAKANSRATVHRPVYLDYVGVKKFDADGEVVGERRFLGLFSLGRLHRVA